MFRKADTPGPLCRPTSLGPIDTLQRPAYIPEAMAKSTFGDRLKREREMRGVSLEEISTATRIGTRFLEALETEQWDRLPGGVFNRGFVRAVARFLGLDEEDMVAEYALATNDQREVAVWALSPPAPPPGRNWRPSLLVAIGIVFVGVAWFGWNRFGYLLPWSAGPDPATPHSTAKAPLPEDPPAQPPSSANCGPLPLELKVDAGRTAQVTIVADGKKVFEGQMKPSKFEIYCAQEYFEVSANNSTALVIELNGQLQLLPALPDQPGTIRLTRESLKKNLGGRD